MKDNFIQFKNITKRFGGTIALNNVSFDVRKGEVHCLCGENGSGKSTLINICGGIILPNDGEILLNGKSEKIISVHKSESLGFSIVHQEIPLCSNMSIAHNVFLGSPESMKGLFINENYMCKKTQELLDLFQLKLNPVQLIETLSIAEQSVIQIAKAVYFRPEILVLDEPTAALTNNQREVMFNIIKKLKEEQGTTIIYVSHRLEEVMEIGDRVTVLRDGHLIKTLDVADVDVKGLVTLMVGREIDYSKTNISYATDEILMQVKGLTKKSKFENVSFDLRKGEILGFGGFVGAGRTEVLMAIFGDMKADSGEIIINGKKSKIKSPSDSIKKGISLIPENRRDDALIAEMSIKQNALLVIIKELVEGIFINKKKAQATVNEMIKKYSIKAGNINDSIMSLSGGNQQKVVISRWISNNPKILLCDEPTRGIDVGAKSEVYAILRTIAKQGIGVVVVSSELPELLSLCDRIIVMHEGKITGELSREEATEEAVMLYAAKIS
jgi:ABC-type sugar transport system ATPase subunit